MYKPVQSMVLSLTLAFLALTWSNAAVTPLVLYDNFQSTHIDPAKWVGEPASLPNATDKDRREVKIELVGEDDSRRLHISQTAYSSIADNNGDGGVGFGLGFANPSMVKSVSFTLAVGTEEVGCGADDPAWAGAGFFGDYFNPSGAQDGQTGDIVASIGVGRLSTDNVTTLDASASVSQCQDAQCNGQTVLVSQDLGPVQAGSTNRYSATWDQPNHQFVFRLNNNASVALPYNLPDSLPPGLSDKSFYVFASIPHCTTAPRPVTQIDAFVGSVYVNR